MELDRVSIDAYHEAALAERLGYSLFCRIDGIDADLVVREVRIVAGDNSNYEVRVLEGWRKPAKCWAIGLADPVRPAEVVEQKGLFG